MTLDHNGFGLTYESGGRNRGGFGGSYSCGNGSDAAGRRFAGVEESPKDPVARSTSVAVWKDDELVGVSGILECSRNVRGVTIDSNRNRELVRSVAAQMLQVPGSGIVEIPAFEKLVASRQ